jgi:glycosyltransferase involved in cell wall biosynthesis
MGWSHADALPPGEQIALPGDDPLLGVPDWRERVHVIPGYSRRVYWQLATWLSWADVPWVHWSENSQPSWRSPLSWIVKRAWARRINRYALGAFAQGLAAERDFVRWGIRREQIAHLFYAVNCIPAEAPPDPETARFVAGRTACVYVGSISRNKATKVLVRAFALAAADQPGACLVVVGNGPHLDACRRLAARLGVADRVLFRGVVARDAVGSVLKCCLVAALPSRYDGWGVALNEAASAGLALVATDRVGAALHLVEPCYNGFRVRAGSAGSLAAALRAYFNDPALAAQHGRRSRQVFDDFKPQRNVERFISAIRSWLAADARRSAWRDDWNAHTMFTARAAA